MSLLSGAETFAEGLEAMGTTRLYGIIGTSILGFFEGLYGKQDRIRYISCRHEQVAASMAEIEGRLTGRPGVAVVHSGPGALNAMISAGNAYKDCSPMILITGAVKSRLKGTDGMLEADHPRLFSPFAKASFRVTRTADIPGILSNAYESALKGAWGPVVIEVPEDIWAEKGEIDENSFCFKKPSPVVPEEKEIGEILEALERAQRPVILAGCGIAYAGASSLLKNWVERMGIPVITTGNGRGVLSEDHPLSFGRVGFGGGNPVADEAFCKSDVLVGLGCGISDMVTYEFTQTTSADVYLVNYDPSAKDRQVTVTRNVLSDVGSALKILLKKTEGKKFGPYDEWKQNLETSKKRWNGMLFEAGQKAVTPLSPGFVMSKLDGLLPKDAIVCGGAGLHVVYANNWLKARGPLQFLAAVNFGAMGLGMPAAMSAKLAFPKREVVAVLGDGEFLMTVQDLETVAREKIGIKIFIVNDNCYRVLEFKQRIQYHGHIIGTRHSNPDFTALARAFGIKAIRLQKPEEVDEGLKAALRTTEPVIVELVIDPNDLPPTNLEAAMKMGMG